MKTSHTYPVRGLHCGRCVGAVETALSKTIGVISVKVDLSSHTATVEMDRPIEVGALNNALKETKYRLEGSDPLPLKRGERKIPKPIRDFLPLIALFAAILAYTAAMVAWRGTWDWVYAMRHFEGAFFILFGSLKLLNWKGFVEAYATYDLLAARSRLYGYAYPLIELAMGAAYLANFQLRATCWITLILMTLGSLGVARALARKQQIQCACIGVVFKLPMTKVTLLEDLLMGAMALGMIVWMSGN